MKKSRRETPTSFEVALEKGDYQPYQEAPSRVTPEDEYLLGFIQMCERLDFPDAKKLVTLTLWKAFDRNCVRVAQEMGDSPQAVSARINRLKKRCPHRPGWRETLKQEAEQEES